MKIEVRESTDDDLEYIQSAMTALQEYLVPLDPEGLIQCPDGCGEEYTLSLLDQINRNHGKLFIAVNGHLPVGLVAGIVEIPKGNAFAKGQMLELFVDQRFRGCGIGASLVSSLEQYFRGVGCERIEVKVFLHNCAAIQFYEGLGYEKQQILMKVFCLTKALEPLR
jgi:ribosomal protein S18 acetylase RimI-like enzyme